jgi:hypothetical protein
MTKSDRGYGTHHRRLRKIWAIKVEAGGVRCARCGRLIQPGAPWDLGHDDNNRQLYAGPEHRRCNRGAPHRKVIRRQSRIW